jgi:hypothetical protein
MKFNLMLRARSHRFPASLVATVSNLQFSSDTLHYRKICAVPSALFAHIFRPHNVPANA